MTCAVELLAMRYEAEEKRRKAEEEERKKREVEKAEFLARIAAEKKKRDMYNIIDFCELTINPELIKKAKEGKGKIEFSIPIRFDNYDKEEFMVLIPHPTSRYKYYINGSEWMNTKMLKDYLKENYLSVRFEEADFLCWNGYYYNKGANLIVTIDTSICK